VVATRRTARRARCGHERDHEHKSARHEVPPCEPAAPAVGVTARALTSADNWWMRWELAVMPRPHSKPRAYVRLQLFVADADVFEVVTGGVVVAQHRPGAGVVRVRAVVV